MSDLSAAHEILVGSTTTKLQLAKGYTVTPEPVEHQRRMEIGQKNWMGGHGQYEFNDGSMYYDGQSIDTTQIGRVFLGPKINEVYLTAASKDSFTSSADGSGFSVDGLATGWYAQTFTTGSAYTIGAVKLYGRKVVYPGTITVSIRATAAGAPTGADLCSGTFDGNTLTSDYAWFTVPITAPVALTTATVYAICVRATATDGTSCFKWDFDAAGGYASGASYNSTDSGATWSAIAGTSDLLFNTWSAASTALDATPTYFFWSATAGKWLCATAGKIYIYDVGWTAATTTVAGVTHFAEYNGVIYAATGASVKYYYSTDGDTWTQTDLTDGYAVKLLSCPNPEGTDNLLYKLKTPNELSTTTNGKTVAASGVQWTSAAYIGDTTNNVTNLMLNSDELLVGRTDNLFKYGSGGGVFAQMDELKFARSTQNFRYVFNWQGSVYFSKGNHVWELTGSSPGLLTDVDPLVDTGDLDKVGEVRGISGDTDYLYVAKLEGTVTHIYKGRPGANGRWAWCPWVYLGKNQCEQIAVAQHSTTDRRLWFGYSTHTGYVQITDNPTADANARFSASGSITMSYLYGSNPYWDKMVQSAVIEAYEYDVFDITTANWTTIAVKYWTDAQTGTGTTCLAAYQPTGDSDCAVSKTFSAALTGKRIRFKLDLTGNGTSTPIVRAFIVKGSEKPEVHRIHDCTYYAGSKVSELTRTVRDALRTAKTSTSLVKLADLRYGVWPQKGTSGTQGTDWVYVTMEEGPDEQEIIAEKGKDPEVLIHVKWREV